MARSTYNLGRQQAALGRNNQAEQSYRATLTLLEEAIDQRPDEIQFRLIQARATYNLGHLLGSTGESDEAKTSWEQSLSQWRSLATDFPDVSEYHSRVGATLSNLAVLAKQDGDLDVARSLIEEAIARQERALSLEPIYHNAEVFMRIHVTYQDELNKYQIKTELDQR